MSHKSSSSPTTTMAQTQQQTPTVDPLKQIISETLSPYAETRRNAELCLKEAQKSAGHPLEVLGLVTGNNAGGAAIRQAAAVHFKNIIKKGWDVNNEDGNDGIVISPEDRNTIKSHLVQLMCTTPPEIQIQLSESISLIASVDYFDNWQNLLPELVQQFTSTQPTVAVGVLKTANSIFKSFRFVQRSDDLYRVILYTLNGIQAPLLTLAKQLGMEIDGLAKDPVQLRPRLEALRLVCRIFYSLNFQDLPEYFEDHMKDWMGEFARYLQYTNPVVTDVDEEDEPSPIDRLQAAIIENLDLYAGKDEEAFMEYLPNFAKLIWNLLMTTTNYPKHDTLATTSIRFLSSLVQKQIHRNLFHDEATLRQIVLKIVIPNLMFRETDEEKFEDDPREYIATEVEGCDGESRRKCSQDLLRSMCRHFENETTAIISEHVGSMLSEYASDPNSKWAAKDAAIHLMMGIAIRRESIAGVSEVNDNINVMDFFQSQILPELQDANHADRPVVKATSVKFVGIFRNQFTTENLVQLIPLLVAHLGSPIVVVHTFSAYAIERILMSKTESASGQKVPRISSAVLKPVLDPLLRALFAIVDSEHQNENDYVMKCVMRSLSSASQEVIPVTEVVITKLTAALGRVAKNPRNPQFNHYLFESLAVLIQSVCSREPLATNSFEPLLFEPFNLILQMDITEFTPYVFQILAQLLEYRPDGADLGSAYRELFAALLTPALWEKRGNVPALARLIQAYIVKAPAELVPKLNPILGVFQKLISSKATEASAFEILNSATIHFPVKEMCCRMVTIFQILLARLQAGQTARYVRLVTNYFALHVAKYGADDFVGRMNAIQNGLVLIVLSQVWVPRIPADPPVNRLEAKIQLIGLTKLICEAPGLLADKSGQQVWAHALGGIVFLLTSSTFRNSNKKDKKGEAIVDEDIEIGYDAQFSQLQFAKKKAIDPLPEWADPQALFVQSFRSLYAGGHAAQLRPLMKQAVAGDPKLEVGFESILQEAGIIS